MTRRPRLLAAIGVLVAVGVVAGLLIGGVIGPGSKTGQGDQSGRSGSPGAANGNGGNGGGSGGGTPTPVPTPRPAPGHEVYGFVPYWEMDERIAAHLAKTDLTTVALFSVTNTRTGAIDTSQKGYLKIVGPLGEQLIREAHDRGTRVEIVFSSFGTAKNKRLFGSTKIQDAVISGLVGLVGQTGTDGVNVDVEQVDPDLVPAYGSFVGRLRTALRADHPKAQVSVATTANVNGATMAAAASGVSSAADPGASSAAPGASPSEGASTSAPASAPPSAPATAAGADRIFMMGYDYHWPGSAPGASAPITRRDGSEKTLSWSLDLYESLGVPVQRTILGLPLYGTAWPVDGPEVAAPQTGKGAAWIPSDHLDILNDPTLVPVLDELEQVEIYTLPTDKDGTPTANGTPTAAPSPAGWLAIYIDSPTTLKPKIHLATERGLAGVGFWAIGYEQGLPDFTDLIGQFRTGKLD